MSQVKPIVDYLGKQSEMLATDVVAPQNLGTGIRDGSKFLRDDNTWQMVTAGGGVPSIVATRIRRSTNQSIPTGVGWTDLVFDVSTYQTGGTFWTSGATTTIPETGLYFITTEITFDGTGLTAIATINLQTEAIMSGVTTIIGDDEKQLAINSKGSLFIFAQRYFTAGDTIKNQIKHSDTGSLNILSQATHSPDIIITKVNGAKGEPGASASNISNTAILSFPIVQEEEDALITINSVLLTNLNFKTFNYLPLISVDHEHLDDFQWDGLYFNIENIVDNTSFDIRATSKSGTWGNYNIKYIITY